MMRGSLTPPRSDSIRERVRLFEQFSTPRDSTPSIFGDSSTTPRHATVSVSSALPSSTDRYETIKSGKRSSSKDPLTFKSPSLRKTSNRQLTHAQTCTPSSDPRLHQIPLCRTRERTKAQERRDKPLSDATNSSRLSSAFMLVGSGEPTTGMKLVGCAPKPKLPPPDNSQTVPVVRKLQREFEEMNAERRRRALLSGCIQKFHWLQVLPNSEQNNKVLRQLILESPAPPTWTHRRKDSERVYRRWKRYWEIAYAVLAITELINCQNGGRLLRPQNVAIEVYVNDVEVPLAFVTPPTIPRLGQKASKTRKVSGTSRRRQRIAFIGKTKTLYWGKQIFDSFRELTGQELINRLFIVAIALHTIMESWRIASSRKQGVEAKIVRSSRKVTQRTKQRVYKLETCSTNRHFLMRLTGNRIKWTGTMTEIAWVAFTLVMTRILFLPFLTSNPFMPSNYGMEHNAQQMIPQQQNDQLLSIADSMLFAFTSWFYSRAVTHLRRKVKQHAIKFLTHALIRPWEASNRLQKAFAVARWTKFLAPLVGTSNKLRGHYIDYLRKTAQKRRSDNAQFRWEEMARSIRSERQLERAVRRIQKAFRLQRQIKLVSVRPPANAHTLKGIVSLQRRFRSRSALNRLRILRAKSRLSGIGPAKRILSCDTGLLIDDLKKEIRTRTRKTRTLLIRPNTCFSVWWKRMTIVCVVIEIAQLLLAPKLAPHLQKVPVVELVLHLLTPIYIIDPSAPYLKVWLYFVGIFSRCTSDAVRLISFLDVFVTFFTGDLDSATGLLIPKPLVTRWIIPGVALQLLANPAMKDVSQIARRGVVFVNSVGPVRVFHALVALLPALHFLVENAIDTLYTFVCVRTGTQHRCDGTCGHSHKS